MEKRSIDLNQHAFDLNEAPLNDPVTGFSDTHAPDEVSNPWLPKKGGWLELFCKMFGQESLVMNVPITDFAGIGNGVFNANHNRIQADAMNYRYQTSQCEQGSLHNREKRKLNETNWNSNADASQNGKCNKTLNEFSLDGSQVQSIFHVPCLPLAEQGNLCNGSLGKSGSNYTSSHNLRASSTVDGQACRYPFHIEPEQGSSYLSSTDALRNGFNHNISSIPLLDLNLLPCPVSNVNFQSPLQQVNPLPNEYFQSFSHVTPQSIKVCQSFYSVNDLGKPPEGEHKNKQKITRNFLKRGSEQRIRKDYSTASEGCRDFELITHQPSSTDNMEVEGQEPRIRIIASPNWLPEGWITELKTRKAGSTAGTTDKYYKDPVTGRRFRSKNEVMNYLLTGNICRHKLQLKSCEGMIPFLNGSQTLETEQTAESPENDANLLAHDFPRDIFPGKICVKKEREEEILRNSAILQNAFLPLNKGKLHDHSSSPTSKHLLSKAEENKFQQTTLLVEKLGGKIPSTVTEKIDARASCCSFSESVAAVERNSTDDVQTNFRESLLSLFGMNQISDIVDCNNSVVTTGRHHHHPQQQKGLINKVNGKKALKLTLKHEREVLISLGRKLCQEFLTSAHGTVPADRS